MEHARPSPRSNSPRRPTPVHVPKPPLRHGAANGNPAAAIGAKAFRGGANVTGKSLRRAALSPSPGFGEPTRQGYVLQGAQRFNTVVGQCLQHVFVMEQGFLVKNARFWLDTAPFQAEKMRVVPQFPREIEILRVIAQMPRGLPARGLIADAAGPLFPRPPVVVEIATFAGVGGQCRAPQKLLGELPRSFVVLCGSHRW